MIGEKPKGVRAHLPLAYPALMLAIFFINNLLLIKQT